MWQEQAACAGMDTNIFFGVADTVEQQTALETCRACPVRTDCLDTALARVRDEDYGVWGGTTSAERDRMRNRKPSCGTYPGHLWHVRRGETCIDCLMAAMRKNGQARRRRAEAKAS